MSKLVGVSALRTNLDKFSDGLLDRAELALDYAITESENEAKHKAPWKDRTGNARNSITGSGPSNDGKNLIASLSIGVFYGKYLELCHQGKYRIVWPTLEGFSRQELINQLRGIL